jgi:acid-activated urea channel
MGFLGLSLLFVGIVLVMNGVNRFLNVDAKSTAFMNLVTGGILVLGNFIMLLKAAETPEITQGFVNVSSGFLFGFTYIFVACNYLFKLDLRPFGWFCGFVAVYAVIMSVNSFIEGSDIGLFLGGLWAAWALLWAEGFIELALGAAKVGKVYPYLAIAEGLFAAFIPSVLMLLEVV